MWDLLCQESRDIDPVIEPCVQGLFGAEENHESEPDSDAAESDSESAEHAMADVAHANEGYGNCRNVSPNAAVGMVHRHSRTKVLHFEHIEDSNKTACGRMLGLSYVRFHGDPDKAWPHCSFCWGNVNV